MTSGRCFPAAPQNRKNQIGRGFRNKSCLWSCGLVNAKVHQTQVIPSKPVRRRHPCLGRPGPPQRPQRRGRVDVRSGPGDFLFHLRGRIRGAPLACRRCAFHHAHGRNSVPTTALAIPPKCPPSFTSPKPGTSRGETSWRKSVGSPERDFPCSETGERPSRNSPTPGRDIRIP